MTKFKSDGESRLKSISHSLSLVREGNDEPKGLAGARSLPMDDINRDDGEWKGDANSSNVDATDGLQGGDINNEPGVCQLSYPESKESKEGVSCRSMLRRKPDTSTGDNRPVCQRQAG